MKQIILMLLLLLSIGGKTYASNSPSDNDLYIYGYVTALLQERYNINSNQVVVKGGIVFLDETLSQHANFINIKADLSEISGVEHIQMVPMSDVSTLKQYWLFPTGTLFAPLIADPRWPSFSAGYNHYLYSNQKLHNVINVSFGREFSMIRNNFIGDSVIDVSIQAAVFAFFDLDAPSFDLLNADYFVGIPVTYKNDKLSWFIRYHHQSSHLGDEYIINSQEKVNRINLSYEKLDSVVSYDITEKIRVYGGGGFFARTDPGKFKKWSYQTGFELRPELTYNHKIWNLIFATHITGLEETGYSPNISSRLGIILDESYMLSLDFFHGNSPNGQFYKEKGTWVGVSFNIF